MTHARSVNRLRWKLRMRKITPQGLKSIVLYQPFTARLKSCPDAYRQILHFHYGLAVPLAPLTLLAQRALPHRRCPLAPLAPLPVCCSPQRLS
jgi:hypothetical protein